jgi:hypothetical protein
LVNEPITSPSALDLRYNASVAKLDTRGGGLLEIDHLALIDGGSDCAPFIQSTNTTLRIHDNTFYGTASGGSACNNAIVLGGSNVTTGIVVNGTATSAFQGYGTVIRDNNFYNSAVIVTFNNYANSAQVIANTISRTSGNQSGNGAAFDFGYSTIGNYVAGNLVEVSYYKLGFHFQNGANYNHLEGNQTWDPTGDTTASYGCDSGSVAQFLLSGYDATTGTAQFGTCYNNYGNYTQTSTQSGLYTNMPYIGVTDLAAPGTGSVNIGNATNGYGLVVIDPGGTLANYLSVNGATTGNAVTMKAAGSDTNIELFFASKGTGTVLFRPGSDSTTAMRVQNAGGSATVLNVNTTSSIVDVTALGAIGTGNTWISNTAPTIASGFGSTPSVANNNGTAAFTINVGTGGSATSGVVTMPSAAHGWSCSAVDSTTPASFVEAVLPTSATSITIDNYSRTTGLAIAWTASDVLAVQCTGY